MAYAVWHPDGRRITTWVTDSDNPIPNLSTEPVDGGPVVESKFPPELQRQIESAAPAPNIAEWRMDFRFAWAPSGKAIFFERTFRGARNVWRMTVDPVTLQPTTVERLTTSPGLDVELSVSPDGSKLAFTSVHQQIRAWTFPFDAIHGRISGPGQPVTSAGIEAWALSLSRDGKKLGIWGSRDGQIGTWEESAPNGPEEPLMAGDSYTRDPPIWSPDGKRAAYMRRTGWQKREAVVWSSETRSEEVIAADSSSCSMVYDWSPDGKSVFAACGIDWTAHTHRSEIWQLSVDPSVSREFSARKIIADPNYDLWQSHVSPDHRWLVFEGSRDLLHRPDSTIFAMPAAGGRWIQITDGKQWDDKPRWSPDGKTIYFLSDRQGFFNLWGIHFDPVKGHPQGEP